jgi:hypothetical protein
LGKRKGAVEHNQVKQECIGKDGIPMLHRGLPEKLGLPMDMQMQGILMELIGSICKG